MSKMLSTFLVAGVFLAMAQQAAAVDVSNTTKAASTSSSSGPAKSAEDALKSGKELSDSASRTGQSGAGETAGEMGRDAGGSTIPTTGPAGEVSRKLGSDQGAPAVGDSAGAGETAGEMGRGTTGGVLPTTGAAGDVNRKLGGVQSGPATDRADQLGGRGGDGSMGDTGPTGEQADAVTGKVGGSDVNPNAGGQGQDEMCESGTLCDEMYQGAKSLIGFGKDDKPVPEKQGMPGKPVLKEYDPKAPKGPQK